MFHIYLLGINLYISFIRDLDEYNYYVAKSNIFNISCDNITKCHFEKEREA